MSVILAIETSTELASAAILFGDSLVLRQSAGAQTHSQSILPMVQSLLAEASLPLQQCDAIAFGAGPGSFTGVRTACGIVQGLAFGACLPRGYRRKQRASYPRCAHGRGVLGAIPF